MPLPKRTQQKRRQRIGGRESLFTLEQLTAHGVALGLANLSVQAVAESLGVTPAAVYRRVKSRLELETLVGEAILGGLHISNDTTHTTAEYLIGFAGQLRAFCLANPGTAHYIQQAFPRGDSGVRLLMTGVEALGLRGYHVQNGIVLLSAVATITVGQVIGQENRTRYFSERAQNGLDPTGMPMEKPDALSRAEEAFPPVTHEEYFALLIRFVIDGLITNLPVETEIAQWLAHQFDPSKGKT